jgi:hypothetical protein
MSQSTKLLDRYALHISVPWEKQTLQQRKAAKKIPEIFQTLNQRVADLITQVSSSAETKLSSVRLMGRPRDQINGDLGSHIVTWGEGEASSVRAVVSPFDLEDAKVAAGVTASHIVRIEICRDKFGWYSGGATAHAVVRTTEAQWPQVIEDILLDISMFHSFPDRHQAKDVARSVASGTFDFSKSSFVASLKKDSCYGPIVSMPRYLAISSFCRYGAQLETGEYVHRWTSFLLSLKNAEPGQVRAEGGETGLAASSLKTTSQEAIANIEAKALTYDDWMGVVEDILRRHRKGPQISAKKLRRLIVGLPRGSYLLLRTERKPRRTIAVTQLSFLFGPGLWKTGKMKVVKTGNLRQYKAFNPYISILRFEVPGR